MKRVVSIGTQDIVLANKIVSLTHDLPQRFMALMTIPGTFPCEQDIFSGDCAIVLD